MGIEFGVDLVEPQEEILGAFLTLACAVAAYAQRYLHGNSDAKALDPENRTRQNWERDPISECRALHGRDD